MHAFRNLLRVEIRRQQVDRKPPRWQDLHAGVVTNNKGPFDGLIYDNKYLLLVA